MALTKETPEILYAFGASPIAQNVMVKSNEKAVDASGENSYIATFHIKSLLNTTTAHTGTRFILESYDGKEWQSVFEFVELIGTSNSEAITNNPLEVGQGVGAAPITCASTTGYLVGAILGIADGANSETHRIAALATNTSITLNDAVIAQHAQNTLMYSVAVKKVLTVDLTSHKKIRWVIDNTYDADGSTVLCEIAMINTTKL